MLRPIRPVKPSELAVIAISSSVLLIALGVVGLAIGYLAPPEKRELAAALIRYAWWSCGIGAFVAASYWLVRRITS